MHARAAVGAVARPQREVLCVKRSRRCPGPSSVCIAVIGLSPAARVYWPETAYKVNVCDDLAVVDNKRVDAERDITADAPGDIDDVSVDSQAPE